MYKAQLKNTVFVLYEGDSWLSTSSLRVKAVCDSFETAVNMAVAHYDGNDNTFDLESELRETGQYRSCELSYMIQSYDLNEWD